MTASSLRPARIVLLLLFLPLLPACGSSPTGLAGEPCGPTPYFTALPIAEADIDMVTVVGGLGAPGHTIPTNHAGIYLAREGVTVYSPGDIQVTSLRKTTWLASPRRQGRSDFSIEFSVCERVSGWFAHVTSLSSAFPANINWGNCETYSTADETVEACSTDLSGVRFSPGQVLGTGGMSAPLGLLGFDFGLLDERVTNFYVSRWRYPLASEQAICPWEQFDAASQVILFSKLRDPSRGGETPAGEPRCGTMQVDVAGTAQGVWAELGVTSPLEGDERRYVTLANHPYRPQTRLALSLGPTSLGATVGVSNRATSGRVNRAFDQVGPDGLIYCYESLPPSAQRSWFISLAPNGRLTVRRVDHPTGAGPCQADPASWSFGANTVTLER